MAALRPRSEHQYFAFPDIDGETLVVELDKAGFAVASGAACSSASTSPRRRCSRWAWSLSSHAAGAFSLGKDNTAAQVDDFLRVLGSVLTRLKTLTAIAV